MTYFDSRPNDILRRRTPWHNSTPGQMTCFRRATNWHIFDYRPNDIFRRSTKWHITKWNVFEPCQMTYFDARPNENDSNSFSTTDRMTYFVARPNDILPNNMFSSPAKWHISTPDQMTYFDARPNEIDSNSRPVHSSWRQTKWHISTPDQIANIHSRPNYIFRRPTKWLVFDSSPNYIIRCPTKWHI